MRRIKGRMGALCDALAKNFTDTGGTLHTRASVKSITIENGRAVGVEINNGDTIKATIILSNLDKLATMQGATEGDFTHELIHPENILGERAMVEGLVHLTQIESLYMCGSACHPGLRVTFLPGYNCGNEVYARELAQYHNEQAA